MKNHETHQYSFAADVIRNVAIFGVVSIHVVLSIYNRPDFQGGTVWMISNLWNAVSRSSIPLFIMLSGYLLIPKPASWQKTQQRIFHRLLIPLLFWFLWYRFWRQGYMSYQDFRISSLLQSFITGSVGHLYFLVIMIGLYTVLPLIQKQFSKLKLSTQKFVTLFFLLIGMIVSFVNYLTGFFPLNNLFLMWVPYLGFFLAGHVIGKLQFSPKVRFGLLAVYLTTIIATAYLSDLSMTAIKAGNTFLSPAGSLSPYFDFYLSPNVVLMSLTAFALLISQDYGFLQQSDTCVRLIKKISALSFSIYLVHLIIVNIIEVTLGLGVDFVKIPLIVYLIAKFITVFIGAILLSLLLQQFAFFRKMLGEKVKT